MNTRLLGILCLIGGAVKLVPASLSAAMPENATIDNLGYVISTQKATAAAMALSVNASGAAVVKTTVLTTPEELDMAVQHGHTGDGALLC